MATVQNVRGTVNTAVYAGGVANKVTQGLIDGRVKVMQDTYTVAATDLSATSTIKMCKALPVGAKVLAILFTTSVSQGSATLAFGDALSASRYAAATTYTGAGTLNVIEGLGYIIGTSTTSDDTQLLITTAVDVLSAGTLYVKILYTTD